MAMREREEEQTQLTMVALNETMPFYPGKTQEEAQSALQEVRGCPQQSWEEVGFLSPSPLSWEEVGFLSRSPLSWEEVGFLSPSPLWWALH